MTLTPYPFGALVRRMFRELDAQHAIFDLPARRFFGGDADCDLSVSIHGQRASSPVGPAAGPHTQLAQNIVLAWLAGCRVVELKTVQVRDDLVIPRPVHRHGARGVQHRVVAGAAPARVARGVRQGGHADPPPRRERPRARSRRATPTRSST
jgi:hypothetical protein